MLRNAVICEITEIFLIKNKKLGVNNHYKQLKNTAKNLRKKETKKTINHLETNHF